MIEQAHAENLKNITRLLAQIRDAEALAAAGKNALRKMGIETYKIAVVTTDAHSVECSAASLMGDYLCICPPEAAFTSEVF